MVWSSQSEGVTWHCRVVFVVEGIDEKKRLTLASSASTPVARFLPSAESSSTKMRSESWMSPWMIRSRVLWVILLRTRGVPLVLAAAVTAKSPRPMSFVGFAFRRVLCRVQRLGF